MVASTASTAALPHPPALASLQYTPATDAAITKACSTRWGVMGESGADSASRTKQQSQHIRHQAELCTRSGGPGGEWQGYTW